VSLGPRAQVAVLVVAALLAGAGVGAVVVTLTKNSSDTTTTLAATAAATSQAATAAVPGTAGDAATEPTAVNPAVGRAIADVEAKGYLVSDRATYVPGQQLSVLVGSAKGSAAGDAQKAFFFADGALIGTDTADPSAGIRVVSQSDDEIGLRYTLFTARDPQCCPTDGSATVYYRWDGTSLKPLGPIPTSSLSADKSRR